MEQLVNILLADDHRIFAEGLLGILQKNFKHASFTTVDSGEAAWATLSDKPDAWQLLITDISMAAMNGIELTRKVKAQFPKIKVLVLSMHDEREIISAILEAEAEGYVLKNSTAQDIVTAVSDILNDKTHYGREVLNVMLQKMQTDKKKEEVKKVLSARELEILQLIIEEYSSEEIGEKLFISKRTVETHRANILEKTGCHNIIGLIKYAVRSKLVTL
jgi:DNA-binding NarL/FixJ family response regulator